MLEIFIPSTETCANQKQIFLLRRVRGKIQGHEKAAVWPYDKQAITQLWNGLLAQRRRLDEINKMDNHDAKVYA